MRPGIQQQSPQRGEIGQPLRIVFQTRNQQVVWRVLVLLVSLLCAQKWLWRSPQHDHSVLFFKLYSTDRPYNLTQNLEHNAVAISLPRRKLASQIHDSCPQFRLFGGFSHTLWDREYYVKIALGKLKKIFHFQIDTGSSVSWLHCKWPTIQEHPPDGPNGMYMPEKQQQIDCRLPDCKRLQGIPMDRTHILWACDAKNDWQCIYDVTYYDHSNYRGLFVDDVATFETPKGHKLQAAISLMCSWHAKWTRYDKDNMKKWPLTSDGLIGLNKDKLSFVSQLKSQGVISSNTIGHCLRSLDTTDFQEDSGFMFFGKHKILDTIEIAWTPMTLPSEAVSKKLYEVYVKNIKLGQLSLEMTDKPNVMNIDCGSTRSYIAESIFKPIKEQVIQQANLKGYVKFQDPIPPGIFDTQTANDLKDCWCIPENGIPEKDFETIQIELAELAADKRKAMLNLKPEQYLAWKGCVTPDNCKLLCLTLEREEAQESPNLVFSIGGFALQGYLVVYDTEEGRVGWMESDCNEDEFLLLHENTLLS